jgi:GT2 family glycosyltransferase
LPTIPIVIPYFRAPEALEKCLAAIKEQESIVAQVFVRDNSDDNILFTCAVNEGLRQFALNSEIEYILVLNQDAYLRKKCLYWLLKTMQDFPKAGIVIPVAVDADNQVTSFAALQAYPWGNSRGGSLEDVPKEPYGTYWANGACMLLRVKMIREIGLLDENMRFICSDSDYSFTARSRGWDVMVSPSALVEHSLNSSAKAGNPSIEEVKLADQLYFGQKWLSGDLYRHLAYEAQALTPEFVAQEVHKSQKNLVAMRQYLSSAQANPSPGS